VVSASDQALLEEARVARAEAERARRLARQISDHRSRDSLLHFARTKEATAVELEQRAFNTKPPVIQEHAQVQQMQQAQLVQDEPDESGSEGEATRSGK